MGTIKLENQVTAKKKITYIKKDKLQARTCDGCGTIFEIDTTIPSIHGCDNILHGIFSRSPTEKESNQFKADVCSLRCASNLIDLEGWKLMKEYKKYANKKDLFILNIQIRFTPNIIDRDEIRKRWLKKEDNEPCIMNGLATTTNSDWVMNYD